MAIKEKLISLLPSRLIDVGKSFPLDCCLPVYHTVSDEELPHVKHCIQYKNIRTFTEDLEFLLKQFHFVSWDEFKKHQIEKTNTTKKIALLTFDDGLSQFKDIILPILEQKGVFAINFINPAFIDNKDLSYRAKASLLVDFLEKQKKIAPEITTLLNVKSNDIKNIQQKILGISYAQQSILDRLAQEMDFSFSKFLDQQKPYLSLDDLKDLEKKGFGIGAHSWDHPLYSELSLNAQLEQSFKSLQYLRQHKLHAESFAFPFTDFGVENEFFEQIFQQEKQLQYTFGCAGIKRDSIVKNKQRIPMENGKTAQKTMQDEIAYYHLKKIWGKNTIDRK